MNILMLGGTGAIGSSLQKLFYKNAEHEVFITSRKNRINNENIKYICGDAHSTIFVESVLKQHRFDVIIDFMQYEYSMFIDRIDLILPRTSQYIYFSSSRVYSNTDVELITENTPRLFDVCEDIDYVKSGEYAILKAQEENALMESQYLNWTIIRPYITYNDHRLQLGVFEKEEWLYRALKGRTVLFPSSLEGKITTMTSGNDVAKLIYNVIGRKDALSKIFQIASNKHVTWGEVLSAYINAIGKATGKKINVVKDFDEAKVAVIKGNYYQLKYDRMYNRLFNSANILKFGKEEFEFSDVEDGLNECLENFIKGDRQFGYISGKMEAVFDIISNEHTPLNQIPGYKEKVKYIITRYTPYIRLKYHFNLR